MCGAVLGQQGSDAQRTSVVLHCFSRVQYGAKFRFYPRKTCVESWVSHATYILLYKAISMVTSTAKRAADEYCSFGSSHPSFFCILGVGSLVQLVHSLGLCSLCSAALLEQPRTRRKKSKNVHVFHTGEYKHDLTPRTAGLGVQSTPNCQQWSAYLTELFTRPQNLPVHSRL